MQDVVLTVNSGSSSLKFAIYPTTGEASQPLIRGKVSGIGRQPKFQARGQDGVIEATKELKDIPSDASHEWIIERLLEGLLLSFGNMHPVAVGHRVVHGGRDFIGPVLVDEAVREALGRLVRLAPSHQPHNLAAIDAIGKIAPGLKQVACFDTSFHRSQPRLAQLYGLPRRLTEEGVIRYGFHGLSYEYIAKTLKSRNVEDANGHVIVAHLGNGASMCAMKNYKSVATTMGFTALDGLLMGRRCGALDPGVVIDLLQNHGLSISELQHLLYRESGLLGVSGISNNMHVLEETDHPAAREAIELHCYRAAREIGSLAAAVGGLDVLVFTAGIGENSALVRRLICEQSRWLGIELDEAANQSNAEKVSSEESRVDVWVIPTDEEAIIFSSAMELIRSDWASL